MQVVKYIMLFLVFISSCLVGKFLSKKYTYRLEELEEMKNALNIFKSKIRFTYEPLPEIFEEISKNTIETSPNIGQIFKIAKEKMTEVSAEEAWKMAIDEVQTNLNKEDINTILMLSKMLGQTDVEGQVSQIEVTRKFFRESNKRSTRRKTKKRKVI